MLDYYLYVLLLAYPAWRICKRTGLNPYLAGLLLVPGLGVILLALLLGFKAWPAARGGRL